MIQDNLQELLAFFNAIENVKLPDFAVTAEDLAVRSKATLPDSLKGTTIKAAPPRHGHGKHYFSMSTFKYPALTWVLSFLAKTKCYLICTEHGDHVHCVHICVTCFDSWPGPGCYLHGSWD